MESFSSGGTKQELTQTRFRGWFGVRQEMHDQTVDQPGFSICGAWPQRGTNRTGRGQLSCGRLRRLRIADSVIAPAHQKGGCLDQFHNAPDAMFLGSLHRAEHPGAPAPVRELSFVEANHFAVGVSSRVVKHAFDQGFMSLRRTPWTIGNRSLSPIPDGQRRTRRLHNSG